MRSRRPTAAQLGVQRASWAAPRPDKHHTACVPGRVFLYAWHLGDAGTCKMVLVRIPRHNGRREK